MSELAELHCIRVGADTPRLDPNEISQLKAKLPGWCAFEKDGEPRLEKVFKFENFDQAMKFTDQVARTAAAEDHHPAITTEWGKVTVTTHTIKGLSENDFIMAAKTEQLCGKTA